MDIVNRAERVGEPSTQHRVVPPGFSLALDSWVNFFGAGRW